MTLTTTPRERRAERTRQAILDAARELITERGAHNLSLREIARRIEYSPAGLYEYFGSKEEIVQAVIVEGFERFANYMFGVSAELPAQQYLHELGMAYVTFAVNNPQHFLLIFSRPELQDSDHEDDGHVSAGTFDTLVNGIKRGVDEGVFPQAMDVMAASFGSWSIVHGIAMLLVTQLRQHEDVQDWEPLAAQAIDNNFTGLRVNAWAAEEA